MLAALRKILFHAGPSLFPISLTLLRMGVGTIMAAHGWQKLTGVAAWRDSVIALGIPAPEVTAWLAILGELGGGVGLALGLLTPLSALGILLVVVTEILTVHAEHGLFASNNGLEYPMTIALVALHFLVRGAGPMSLDALIESRGRRGT